MYSRHAHWKKNKQPINSNNEHESNYIKNQKRHIKLNQEDTTIIDPNGAGDYSPYVKA